MTNLGTGIAAELQQLLAGCQQAGLGYLNYLNSRPTASDEAVVRLKIAEPLLAALGYDLQADLDPEHRATEGAIDILVKANGIPAMVWELKRTQETDLVKHEGQLARYVLTRGVRHAVLTNGRQVRVYERVGDALRFAYHFLSILDGDGDDPMRRVAFPRNGAWHYRTKEALPHAVLLWMHDGQRVTTTWQAV